MLWRIARNLQKDEVDIGHDGTLSVMFWIDRRFAPTVLPPTPEQLVERKAEITINPKTHKDRLQRAPLKPPPAR